MDAALQECEKSAHETVSAAEVQDVRFSEHFPYVSEDFQGLQEFVVARCVGVYQFPYESINGCIGTKVVFGNSLR